MVWVKMAKLVARPFDRMLYLSWNILWFELEMLVDRFSMLLPLGQLGTVRHYAGMALEAFFIAEAFQWLSTAAVLCSFWLFYFFCLPPTGAAYPFVIDWSKDVSPAASHGLTIQEASVACKEMALQATPAHVSALEMHLESEAISGLYQLQVLGINATDAAWRPLLPRTTWWSMARAWLATWDSETEVSPTTRLCLQPAPRSRHTSLHVTYQLRGLYRFVQRWPVLWSVILVVSTGCITWGLVCILLVFLVLRRRRQPEPEPEVEDRSTVKTTVTDVWKQSMTRVEEAGVQVAQAVKNPELQITAASALSGAVALGAGGGCAGLITGSVAGGACGLVPALFTFGLSIPVGVVLGGGAGAAAGTALGSGAGAVLGTVLGRRWVQSRTAEEPATPQSKEL